MTKSEQTRRSSTAVLTVVGCLRRRSILSLSNKFNYSNSGWTKDICLEVLSVLSRTSLRPQFFHRRRSILRRDSYRNDSRSERAGDRRRRSADAQHRQRHYLQEYVELRRQV